MIINEDINTEKILRSIVYGTCLTVFGVSGMGKSKILRDLLAKSEIANFVYLDLHSLFALDENSIIVQFAIELLNNLTLKKIISESECKNFIAIFQANLHLQLHLNTLNTIISLLPENTFLILDHFEKVFNNIEKINTDLFKYIRDINKGKIQYIFAIGDINTLFLLNQKNFGSLTDLVSQKIIFLSISSKGDESKIANLINKGYAPKEIERVSGNFNAYTKVLNSFGTLETSKPLSRELKIVSQRLLNSLAFEQIEILKMIAKKEKIDTTNNNVKILLQLGVIDKNFKIRLPILEIYLMEDIEKNGYTNDQSLTKNEDLIYSLLLKNKNEIVSKEEIAKTIWGNSVQNKYSDWAIDQTLKRLRVKLKKINPDIRIETKRGRGLVLR